MKKADSFMINRITRIEEFRSRFFHGSREGSWNMDECKKYLQQADEFLTLIAVLIHLSSGQPARTPEFLGMTYRNTHSGVRNLFIYKNTIAIRTEHSKASGNTNQPVETIYRFAPPRLAKVIIQYITYIRPFTDAIERLALGNTSRSDFLFNNPYNPAKPWPGSKLTKALQQGKLYSKTPDIQSTNHQ